MTATDSQETRTYSRCNTPAGWDPYEDVVLSDNGKCYLLGDRELERATNVLNGTRDGFQNPFMTYHGNIGTAAHRMYEQFFTGRISSLEDVTPKKTDTDFLKMVMTACANFQHWVRGLHGLVPIAVEVTYPHTLLGYAGTTDFIGWMQRYSQTNPYRVALDWKTGATIKKRDKLQQAAYSMARLRACPNARVDEVGIVRFDKKTLGVVDEWYVEEDGAEMKLLKEEWLDKAERGVR